MYKCLEISDILLLKDDERENIKVHGMVHNIRDMGDFAFIVLRKSEGFLQCVYDKMNKLPLKESAVIIEGKAYKEERAVNGIEIKINKMTVLSSPKEEIPFNISKLNINMAIENEMTVRPAVLRNETKRNIFKIEACIVKAFREYLYKNKFTEIFTPKITSSGAEGGANIFKLEYFGKKACLAQSPQFYKQTLIPVYERVFEIGPVFRAEKHNTTRHLNEYISVDFEMGFINSFYDIINMETEMIKSAFDYLNENCFDIIKKLNIKIPKIDSIPTVKFREAKEMVAKKYSRKIKEPYDLEPEEEKLIGELFIEEYGSDFVFITHYPSKKRPFYAMDDPEDNRYTLTFDLLFRGMEVTTGGQRIHDYDTQVEKMKRKFLQPEEFESYLMLHKYGAPPHGGLGLGLERFMLKLIDAANIRQTSMFPRDTTRLVP